MTIYSLKHKQTFPQISNLQYSVTGAKGAFVPGRGWFIFGGNSDYTQTQQLQLIDGTWTTGNPTFQPDSHYCIVQVLKLQMYYVTNMVNYDVIKDGKMTKLNNLIQDKCVK